MKTMDQLFMMDSLALSSDAMPRFLMDHVLRSKSTFILIEKHVLQDLSILRTQGDLSKALVLETMVNSLLSLNDIRIVETDNFSTINEIERLMKGITFKKITFIMGSMAHAHLFLEQIEKFPGAIIASLKEGGTLVSWKEQSQLPTEAFYVQNDHFLLTDYDHTTLTQVFSPIYGYLTLQTDKKIPGGEAIVYPTYQNLMCKIFKKGKMSYSDFKKWQFMVEHRLYDRHVVMPKDLLFYNHQCVGYVMEKIDGMTTLYDLSIDGYADYSFYDRTKIVYNLLRVLQYIHSNGYLVGDLKPDNILVGPRENPEVYIIDTGSFQVKDYPCTVMQPEYTKRKWTRDMLKKTLRTIDDEYFPINELIFHLLIGVNPYYSEDNVDLPVTLEGRKFKFDLKIPTKPVTREYLRIWYFLPKSIREALYYYFASDRPTELSEWITELERFISQMERKTT